MKPQTAAHPPEGQEEKDFLLAELLESAWKQGEAAEAALEESCGRHPTLAKELRELWATNRFADAFAPTMEFSPPGEEGGPGEGEAKPAIPSKLQIPSFGDYELLGELGRGGMGVVFKARQKSLDRLVALKMVLRGMQAGEEELARFQAEAKAVALLEHPCIVPVYEAGVQDALPYFTMRYVEGETLSAILARGPIDQRRASALLAKIARAVQHAHERGILHRDLKPSNVILDQEGNPQVTDFGLAKRYETAEGSTQTPLTHSGAVLGTPSYMAPEQVSESRGTVGPASDVYSLGVILYEMLTGRPPFRAASPVDTILLVLEQDPVRPRLLNPKVEPDLEIICLRCLQKQAGFRYPSSAALASDLESWLKGESTSVRSGSLAGFSAFFSGILRETHHAVVLENWGLLWMVHSAMILLLCLATWWINREGVKEPAWYILLWDGGLIVWGWTFWRLRKRGGPVLFVERQVGHIWAAAVMATIGIFFTEILLGLPVLTLAPILALIAGTVFFTKAGILSGEFYFNALALFLTSIPMAIWPESSQLLFGLVSGLCFFIPGLKYHRQRLRGLRAEGLRGKV